MHAPHIMRPSGLCSVPQQRYALLLYAKSVSICVLDASHVFAIPIHWFIGPKARFHIECKKVNTGIIAFDMLHLIS